jgi:hypothetical protein
VGDVVGVFEWKHERVAVLLLIREFTDQEIDGAANDPVAATITKIPATKAAQHERTISLPPVITLELAAI